MRVPRDNSRRLKQFARDLRKDSTDAERRLWSRLKQHQIAGYRFRRQYPISGYIVDFFCLSARMAVELDGGQHCTPEGHTHDAQRDVNLALLGVRVSRFSDVDVLKNTDAVVEEIYRVE